MKILLFLRSASVRFFLLLLLLCVSVPVYSQLSGTYTINASSSASSTNYQNFTSAVDDMLYGTRTDGGSPNGGSSPYGISGAVIFKVANGTYNEQIEITAISGASATKTVTFVSAKGDSSKVILTQSGSSSSSSNYTLYLHGAGYITFSKITISRTGSNFYYNSVVQIDDGSNWNNFLNCQVIGSPTTNNNSSQSLFYSGSGGSNDSNNTFINNYLIDGSYGFYWYGSSTSSFEPGTIIKGNIIDSANYSGIYAGYQKGLIVTRNTILNLKNNSYGGSGIYLYYCDTALNVTRNQIYVSGGLYYGYGIYINECTGNANSRLLVANNMVSIGGNNSYSVYGIYAYYNAYLDLFYNSILLTNQNTYSYGLYEEGFSVYQQNNIEDNVSENTGGGSAGFLYYYDLNTSNYNDWYSSGGSNYLSWNGTNYSTLSTFQTASGKDANSLSANPDFYSVTNLHADGPKIYKAGTPVSSVTDDIDGKTRSTTSPCMGADEFSLPANDAGISSIINPSGNFCAGINKVVVSVTNFGGSTLTSAKINWQVNDTAQTAYSWTGSLSSGNTANVNIGSYTLKAGDVYAVKVWTTSPNGGTDGNNLNDTSLVTNLNQGISGTFTIGSGGSYTTFSAAVADLALHGVCGPVVYNVLNGTYKEQITLPAIPGSSATNCVTFQSKNGDSSKVILADSGTSNNTNFAVNLNGAQYVSFHKMTFKALNTNNYGTLVLLQNGANYDSFSNCQLISASTNNSSTNYAIVYGQGAVNNYDVFLNNLLENGAYGFYLIGSNYSSIASLDNGMIIQGNTLQNQYYSGIYVQYLNDATINSNNITTTSTNTNFYGIGLFYIYNGTQVERNRVTGAAGGYGMYIEFSNYQLGNTSNTANIIANNMIQIGSGSNSAYGIYEFYGLVTNLYFNSINITGTNGYAFYYPGYWSNPNDNVENNIFASTNTTGGAYAMYLGSTSYVTTENYNDFYVEAGSNFMNYNGTNYTALAGWVSATGLDNYSVSSNPGFISTSNLTPTSSVLYHVGTSISGISTDINGKSRASFPDIGAVEFTPVSLDAGVSSVDSGATNFCIGKQNVIVTVTNFGLDTLTKVGINWQVNGATQTLYLWTGSILAGKSANVKIGTYTFLAGSTYVIKAWTSAPNGGTDLNHNNDTNLTGSLNSGMSGAYNIGGVSANYSTFNAAVNDLKLKGLCGPVTFNVADSTYDEQVTIPSISGASATNIITFQSKKGDSTKVILTQPSNYSSNYTLGLNGAQYVIFKRITISRTGTGGYGGVVELMNNANENSFYNNIIRGENTTNTSNSWALVYSQNALDTANIFNNNLLMDGAYGFYFQGPSNMNEDKSNVFENNFIDSAYYMGMYLDNESGVKVVNNSIFNLGYSSSYGIYAYECINPLISKNVVDSFSAYAGIYIGFCSGNANIIKNKVYLFGGYGIYTYENKGTSAEPFFIANNFISVGGSSITYGIYDYYPSYENIVFNNVNMTNSSSSSSSFATYTCCSLTGNQFRNNILVNTGGGYSIYVNNWQWQNYYTTGSLTSNNDYYVSGSYFCYNAGTSYAFSSTGLSNWQSAISGDANSLLVNPGYTSKLDLHVSNTSLKDAGIGVAGITDDIDGQLRPLNKPDIGADEFFPYKNDAGCANITPKVPFAPGTQKIRATIENFGTTTLTKVTVDWSVNGTAQTAYSWTGSLGTGDTTSVLLGTINFKTGSSYDIIAYTYHPNGGTDADDNNDTFQESACAALAGGTYTINPSGSGSSNFTSFTNAVSAMSCGGIAGPVTFVVSSGTYNEQIVIPDILGTSNTNRITFVSAANDSSKVVLAYSSSSANSATSANNYTVYMNGGSYITFKDITISATNSSYGIAVYLNNNPSNDSFVNCVITGPSASSNNNSLSNIYYSFSNSINPVTFFNNIISNGSYGVYWYGTSSNHSETTSFIHNQFTNQYTYGAYFNYIADVYFNNNIITSNTSNTNYYGLEEYWLESTSRNSEIIGNKIYGGMAGYGMSLSYISVNSGLTTYIENNSIIMGTATQTNPCYGIYAYWYNPGAFYNNSVVVYGTSTNNYAMSINSAFSATSSDLIENNIFANLGNTFNSYGEALYVQNASWVTLNYNDYYVLGGGNITDNGGTNYNSISSWKRAVSPNDANSVATNPDFSSATNLQISDLCLRGTNLGIKTDINDAARNNPPSLGAYEATGGVTNDIGVDAVESPAAPFSAGSQDIVVRVRNFGTNTVTSGNVSYSVNGSTPITVSFTGTLAQCDTLQVTFSGSNQYSFSGGSIYTVKSWTSLPNSATDNNHSNDTIYSSPLCVEMNGVYTINPSGSGSTNFTSFNAAVNEIECAGISGPVTFNVASGTYSEQIIISSILGSSASNPVVFQSAVGDSSKVILSGTGSLSANYTVELNGATNIKFSKMTIEATNSNYGVAFDLQAGANYDTVTNCQLMGVSTSNTNNALAVVYSSGSVNSYNVFQDNLIQNGSYGFYYTGNNNSTAQMDAGTVIQNNILQNQYYTGMYIEYQNAIDVLSNIITTNSTYTNYFGINMYYTNNACRVLKNKISGAAGGYGIYDNWSNWATNTNPAAIIANNFIAIGSGSNNAYGIYCYYALDQYFYYNSINITSSNGYAMYNFIPYSSPNVNVEDNIFANTSASTGGYAYYLYGTSYVTTENYNDFYVASASSSTDFLSLSGTGYSSVSSWNSATSLDANSISVDPGYYSATNLHSNSASIYRAGTPVSGVNDDIDGKTRSTSKPCIGADEFKVFGNDAGVAAITAPTPGFCAGSSKSVDVVIENYGSSTLTSANILFYINGVKKLTYSWTGSLTTNDTVTVGIGSATFPAGSLVCVAKTTLPNGGVDSNSANDSVISSLSPSLAGTYKIGGAGADFATFSAAVSALNTRGVCAPVTFNVTSGTYNEQIMLQSIPGSSATNTVTFQSAAGDSTKVILTEPSSNNYGSSNYTVYLNGASNVTFKQITISSTGSGYYGYVVEMSNGASNNQVLNCQLIGVQTTNTSSYLSIIYAVAGSGYRDTGNLIENNLMEYGAYAVLFQGSSTASASSGTCDSGNMVIGNTVTGAYYNGLYIEEQEAFSATRNYISGLGYISGYGVFAADNDNLSIMNNQVYLPNGASAGIYLDFNTGTSSTPIIVANNMVSVGGNSQSYGIEDYYNQNVYYYFNSIFITSSNTSSAGFYSYNYYSTPLTIEDNIGFNKGGGFAVYITYGYYITTSGVMNYNDWSSTGSNLGYWQGTSAYNLSNWQSTTSEDASSVSVNPLFYANNNLRAGNSNLAAGTPISSPISITTDIFGDVRSTTTPDIGADEFKVHALDAGILTINNYNYCGSKQNINVTLANYGSTTLTSDSVGWTVNGVAQTYYKWTGSLSSGDTVSVNIGSYSFSSGAYNIVAWSKGPNGGIDSNHNNDTAWADSIRQGMSGTYTIGGSSANYSSFSSAVSDIAVRGVCGAVTFNVASGGYYEQVTIPAIKGASATNNITFQSASGDSSTVNLNYGGGSSNSNNYVLQLNGANYITFKKITIRCSGGVYTYDGNVIDIRGGANNNQFLNNRLIGVKEYYYFYQSSIVYSGTDVDNNNVFKNNLLRDGNYGFNFSTNNSSLADYGIVIQNNIIDSTQYYGIYASYVDSMYIYKNIISNIKLSSNYPYNDVYGIYMYYGNNDCIIGRNKISLLSGGFGMYIDENNVISGSSGTPTTIYDNFISQQGNNYSGYGIYTDYGSYVNVYFNSIFTDDSNSTLGSAGYFNYTSSMNVEDNIFVNEGGGYAINENGGSSYISAEDYNNFYATGGSMGLYSGSTENTLADWQSATSYDASSIAIDPLFLSYTDLHVKNVKLWKSGTPISGISVDIDSTTRNTTAPTIGAAEYFPVANFLAVTATLTPVYGICGDSNSIVKIVLSNNGSATQTSVPVYTVVSGAASATLSATVSSIASGTSDTITYTTTLNTYNGGMFVLTSYAKDTFQFNDTFTKHIYINEQSPTPSITNNLKCSAGSVKLYATPGNSADSIYWYSSKSGAPITSGDSFSTPSIKKTTTYYARESARRDTFSWGPNNINAVSTTYQTGSSTAGIVFDAYVPFTIDSITVYPSNSGTVGVTLYDSSGAPLETVYGTASSILYSYTPVRIHVGITVGIGHNFSLRLDSSNTGGFYYNDGGASYPYKIAGVGSITNTSTNQGSGGYYYGPYDLFIHTGSCPSAFVAVTATIGAPSASLTKDASSSGKFNKGTSANPDAICAGGTFIYDLGTSFSNSTYGTAWSANAYSLKTAAGISATGFSFTKPTTSANGEFTFVTNSSDIDSTFILSVSVKDLVKGCDTVITRYVSVSGLSRIAVSPVSVCMGTSESYNDSTNTTGATLTWNFGDGSSLASGASPSHTYTKAGAYTLKLTITNAAGCTDSGTEPITVNTPPTAAFGATNVSCLSQSAYFSDSSTVAAGDTIVDWKYNFGDGSPVSTSRNTSHQYSSVGTDTVTLTVTSNKGCTSTATRIVTVHSGPKASFKTNAVCSGDSTYFTNTSTVSGTVSYLWNFGDSTATSTLANPSHLYSSGNHTAKLTVTVTGGCTDSFSAVISVNSRPTAGISAPASACVNTSVAIDDSSVTSTSLIFDWNFGDGGTSTFANNNHKYTAAGTYTIRYKIQAGVNGCPDSTSQNINIIAAPTPDFVVDTPVCEGSPLQFRDTSTGGSTYGWNFGDGVGTSASKDPSYTYGASGTYAVTETVTNSSGCSSKVTNDVKIHPVPVDTFAHSNDNGVVTFTQTDVSDSSMWVYGDGNTSPSGKSTINPVHTYTATGSYTVTLTTYSKFGCVYLFSDTVTIGLLTSISSALAQSMNLEIAPNPFTDELHIQYTLAQAQDMRLSIYDVTGKEVTVIANTRQDAGKYTFTVDASKYNMGAGVYFLHIIAGDQAIDEKIIRLK